MRIKNISKPDFRGAPPIVGLRLELYHSGIQGEHGEATKKPPGIEPGLPGLGELFDVG
jgi:hypothetical protein